MAIPLTGGQRILATAARRLFEYGDPARAVAIVRETYDYLTQEQAQGFVEMARQMRVESGIVEGLSEGQPVSAGLTQARELEAWRVADVSVSWTDPSGQTQYRTLRVEYYLDETVSALKDRVTESALQMVNVEANQGNDTIGTAPPDGIVATEIVALL